MANRTDDRDKWDEATEAGPKVRKSDVGATWDIGDWVLFEDAMGKEYVEKIEAVQVIAHTDTESGDQEFVQYVTQVGTRLPEKYILGGVLLQYELLH